MKNKLKKLWYELVAIVMLIDEQDSSATIFYKLVDWYQKNKKFFSKNLIDQNQIERLINVDIRKYPFEQSECTPYSIKNIRHINPSSEDSILSIFVSILSEIVVLRTDHECRICESLGMFALYDMEENKVVLECSVCFCIQTLEGNSHESLTPDSWCLAQNKDLKIAKLI